MICCEKGGVRRRKRGEEKGKTKLFENVEEGDQNKHQLHLEQFDFLRILPNKCPLVVT